MQRSPWSITVTLLGSTGASLHLPSIPPSPSCSQSPLQSRRHYLSKPNHRPRSALSRGADSAQAQTLEAGRKPRWGFEGRKYAPAACYWANGAARLSRGPMKRGRRRAGSGKSRSHVSKGAGKTGAGRLGRPRRRSLRDGERRAAEEETAGRVGPRFPSSSHLPSTQLGVSSNGI